MLHEAEVLRESSEAAQREKNMKARLDAATESLAHYERTSSGEVTALKGKLVGAESSIAALEAKHEESTVKQAKEIESLVGDIGTLTTAHMHAVEKWMAGVSPTDYVLGLEDEKRRFKQTLDENNKMHESPPPYKLALVESQIGLSQSQSQF